MYTAVILGIGLVIILALLFYKRSWKEESPRPHVEPTYTPSAPVQLVHRLCPHNNVVQRFAVEQKDSLDDHLDALTRKLAEKEGKLRISKSKIRETQNEIDNLHAIDHHVRQKYRDVMESLRSDLLNNETECKRIQDQIEWVSHRRAELHDEVRRGQKLYGEATLKLANNLANLQKVRELKVTDKPFTRGSNESLVQRKEVHIPKACSVASNMMKSNPPTPEPFPHFNM
ncbi:uncharacterized protein LOC106716062 isoform X1 [Papilio machaon]|uniref:uncharacterized protein LOC106716062 isoform X1 n=1 Tax=Papilio machaon TaxID=76193 RepID=UPI001E6630BB|nr:uncharacterized protein LOC106716062 isoform X1 [Papilio machaon]XP_045540008.1 uncharacterized protein LOC106716062 isoform X1 [Papilio machaon]